jgi:hypothetical protein
MVSQENQETLLAFQNKRTIADSTARVITEHSVAYPSIFVNFHFSSPDSLRRMSSPKKITKKTTAKIRTILIIFHLIGTC